MDRRKLRPYRKQYSRKLSLRNGTTFANFSQQRRVMVAEGFAPSGARFVGFFSIGRCSAPTGPRCGFFSVVLAFTSICKPPGYSRGLAYVQCMSGIWIVWDGRLLAIWCVFRVYASVVTNWLPTIRKSFATRNSFRGDPRFLCWLPTAVESISDARRNPSHALAA